ncbi:MAG: sulfatase [Isosphaeraceae bacterium]|nr:sulfatase [Isosphaeraceae bacterium]
MRRLPLATVLATLTAALAGGWAAPRESLPPETKADSKSNIVFIISDDHGWRDYGFMGNRAVRTPSLDALAAQSLVYRRGHVPSSLCCPSLASIITGKYPHQHKVTSNDPPRPAGVAPGSFQRSEAFTRGREIMSRHLEAAGTLPKLLAEHGYCSLQTGKWWQGDFRRGGFSEGMTKGGRHGDDGLDIGRKTMKPIDDFIASAHERNQPFFLWYAPMLPHQPHNPPERLLAKYRREGESIHIARYHAMIEWFDESVGQLMEILKKRGVDENTMIVYVADNGWTQNPDAPGFVRSKRSPYDAGLRTPIMIRRPGKVEPGVSDRPVISIDIVPTVLHQLGIERGKDLQGVDLLDPKAVDRRGLIFGECFTHDAIDLDQPAKNLLERWVNDGRWKLIVPEATDAPVELFEIAADPEEKSDVASKHPEVVRRLREQLDGWWNPRD